jgi:hypothetical protein
MGEVTIMIFIQNDNLFEDRSSENRSAPATPYTYSSRNTPFVNYEHFAAKNWLS